jgi:thiol:disulfide interchange protein DsbC
MKKICKFLIITTFLFSCSRILAEEFPPVSEDKQQFVAQSVEKWLKGRYKVDGVSKTPIQEILEVRIGNELIYVDSQANYVILEGRMINLKSGEDLTAIRLDKILTIDFSSLPLNLAIKTQTGLGSDDNKTIVVFEDPYCSYCKKYRMTLEKIKNLTIYTFLFPILSEDSVEISKKIWCSKDKSKAWGDFLIRGIKPKEIQDNCEFPKDDLLSLGKRLGINATPTSYLMSGKRIPGAVNEELLEREFNML